VVDKRSLARDVNERVRALNASFGVEPFAFEVLCECERDECLDRFEMPSSAFDEIRTVLDRFVVASGHEGGARIVGEEEAYRIVALEPAAAYASEPQGRLAQLGERLPYKQRQASTETTRAL
jgi:hypothetical protein